MALDSGELLQALTDLKSFFPDIVLPEKSGKNVSEAASPSLPRRGRKPKKPEAGTNESPAASFLAALPTAAGLPLPSSPMIADMPVTKQIALRLWRLEGLFFTPGDAVRFLASLNRNLNEKNGKSLQIENGTDVEKIRCAPDLEFCVALLRFTGAMAARQSFLPSVKFSSESGGTRAVWQPVFAGLERDRFEALVRAAPPICRAIGGGNEVANEIFLGATSRRFITDSLELLMDALIRLNQSQREKSAKATEKIAHLEWIAQLLRVGMPDAAPSLAALLPQLKEWRRPLTATANAPYRLCLQLEEPDPEALPRQTARKTPKKHERHGDIDGTDAEWRLACYVQPVDDPTLQVSVEEILDPETKQAKQSIKLLHREKSAAIKPHEFAAQALWQAGKLYSPIERSLKGGAPSCFLDSGEAFRFLENEAAPLIEAGFVVSFPSWWAAKGYQKLFGLKVSVKSGSKFSSTTAANAMSLDNLLDVDWDLMLDGAPVSVKELERLASMKDVMVRVRGRWIALSQEELQKAVNFLKRAPRRGSVRDILKVSLGAENEELSPASAVEFGGEPVYAKMLESLAGKTEIAPLPLPEGLKIGLRPYQVRGFSWLAFLSRWGLGACLADDMGLGKTLQTLTLIKHRVDEGETRPTLLVAPTSVLENWRREAERFLPDLKFLVHHGLTRLKNNDFIADAERNDLVATSFALLVRDQALFSKVRWSGVILDEAQNVKNHDSKQAQAARQLPSEYRVALTGTPVENHVGDLWSLMEFLNPGLLGSGAAFKRRFFNPIQKEGNTDAAERLKNVTGPFILRRLKTDKTIIDDLPEKIVTKSFCKLKKEQATLYAAVVKETERTLKEADGIQRKGLVLATLTRLKQICNHPAQYLGESAAALNAASLHGRSGKLERLDALTSEALDAGDRMLIFTQYAEMGEILKRHLQEMHGEETLFLHGGVSKTKRDLMVRHFQEDEDGARLFVLSLKAGGTGLNLTRANHVILFDRWWNPAVEQQAIDRAFRIGQKKNVQVHAFVCQGTMEERIDAMIESKQEIAGMTVKSGEAWLTELSTKDLKELFALGHSAAE